LNPVYAMRAWLGSVTDRRRWVSPLVGVVGTTIASVLFAAPNLVRAILGGLALLLSTLPEVCASWWRAREEDAHGNAVRDQYLVLKSALRPLAELTTKLINERAGIDSRTYGKIVQQAVGAAVLRFPNEAQARAVVFVVASDMRAMHVEAHTGRDQKPGDFVRGNQRGDKAFKILEEGQPVIVRDLDSEKRRSWAGSGDGYRTFITVPITDETAGYGLITLDAPEAGLLTESDMQLLQLIAGMLSVVFASISNASSPVAGTE